MTGFAGLMIVRPGHYLSSPSSRGLYLAGLFLVLLVSGALFFTFVVTLLDDTSS